MKISLIAGIVTLSAAAVFAVDFEKNYTKDFSVPASMKDIAQRNDRNWEATKTALDSTLPTSITAAINTAKAASTNITDGLFRSGVCTSGGTITFSAATRSTPTVVATIVGIPRMADGTATNSALYLSSCSTAGFTMGSIPAITNQIYYLAY